MRAQGVPIAWSQSERDMHLIHCIAFKHRLKDERLYRYFGVPNVIHNIVRCNGGAVLISALG